MHLIDNTEFKKQASTVGIRLGSLPLDIQSIHLLSTSKESASFSIPATTSELPEFLDLLIRASGYRNGFWLIQGGSWHDPCGLHIENTEIHAFLLTKLGLQESQEGVLYFQKNEITTLKALLFLSYTLIAGCVLTDTCLLADTGESIFKISHHNFITAEFKNPDMLSKCKLAINQWRLADEN